MKSTARCFEDLGFDEVADADLGHDGDGDGGLDGLDHAGVGHAGDAAGGADHGGDALEGHDGDGSGFFGDDGLVYVHDVHDDAALEHLGEAGLEAEAGGGEAACVAVGGCGLGVSGMEWLLAGLGGELWGREP